MHVRACTHTRVLTRTYLNVDKLEVTKSLGLCTCYNHLEAIGRRRMQQRCQSNTTFYQELLNTLVKIAKHRDIISLRKIH